MALALYRTYRPGRLADVIGQEHVTVPLGRALDADRAHHAYLFTGPRGCGKTSTARILARSLNCVNGPTSEPCGTCQSCQDLAPNGPGSIDVIEMDAATNRGIDDARELREKAMYAPAASRYKVFIIDEAHQLTKEAWNALLKLIEEPPEHLRFVFATTEPDAVLPTIRSRTHQYPFRLVATRRLQEHLAWTCEQEGVRADTAALTLVARAAQGSVRDAQSILGQLIAGAGPEGVTHADAVAQLGFTDAALLDDVVDALAAGDGRALFAIVAQVVDAGTDPRRFATDLLERLRDLIVLQSVPDAGKVGLLDVPDTALEALERQGAALGAAQLSRAADLVSDGLSQLKGATAPRLQLELLAARLLLPAADDTESGVLARLERLEQRSAIAVAEAASAMPAARAGGAAAAGAPAAGEASGGGGAAAPAGAPEPPPAPPRTAPPRTAAAPPAPPHRPSGGAPPAPARPSTLTGASSAGRAGPEPDAASGEPASGDAASTNAASGGGATSTGPGGTLPDIAAVAAAWPAVLAAVGARSKVALTLAEGTAPTTVSGRTLVVAHPDASRLAFLRKSTAHLTALTEAVQQVTGAAFELDLTLDSDSARARTTAPSSPAAEDTQPTEEELAAPDDADADDSDASPLALVQRELGGSVVQEYDRP